MDRLRDAQVAKLIAENWRLRKALERAWRTRSEKEWQAIAPQTHEMILAALFYGPALAEEQGE